MVLFMLCSLSWAVLFHFGWLAEWHAVALLTVHGIAALLWSPAAQVLIFDIVGAEDLSSAVRLMATSRYLGLFAGPAVGGAILLALGPSLGLVVNSLIYLPLTLWLIKAPFGPRFRKVQVVPARIRGPGDFVATFRVVASVPVLTAMTALGGAYALLIGNAYQAQMPGYARDFGHGDPGLLYSLLLGADASGAVLAGIVLEGSGRLLPRAKTAFVLAMLWCCAIFGFALAPGYPAALVCLFAAGFLELSFNSMAQTLVQLNAPNEMRGRVIGFFSMSAIGLRAFSGVTIGLGGSLIGAHRSLAGAAVVLVAVIGGLAWSMRGKARAS
jgi:MFS family permease